jgi:hypothetical protein
MALPERQLTAGISESEHGNRRKRCCVARLGWTLKIARVLLAQLPELGRINRRERARGTSHRGGRGSVRAALYLASWTATRLAGTLRDFYRRLVAAGKPRQLALIAVARKLLLALNEMMRPSQPWRPGRIPVSA